MKDIKDYLHLYLGCEVYVERYDKIGTLVMVSSESRMGWVRLRNPDISEWQEIKPILRPLSDMTEEEKDDFADHGYEFEDNGELPVNIWKGVNMSGHVLWLLSKGFDLFGLIEAGLAIDKTKLG